MCLVRPDFAYFVHKHMYGVHLGICTYVFSLSWQNIYRLGVNWELSEVSYLGCIFPDYFLRYHFFLLFSPLHNAISGLSTPYIVQVE
jgi:hypothetical protein